MKLILTEKEILTTIRLSETQKTVLASIIAAATPELAYEQISDGRNIVAARDILSKLGLIEFNEGFASVTEEGQKVMKDENLVDEMGQLTDEGQKFIPGNDQPAQDEQPAEKQPNDEFSFSTKQQPEDAPEEDKDLPFESVLIKKLNKELLES